MQDGSSIPTFIIGQEFLDALPVHVFQKTDQGWREHMVDVAVDEDEDEDNTAEVHMRDGTIAKTKAPTSMQAKQNSAASNEHKKIRFRHVLSPGVTPALRNLLHTDDDGTPIGTPSQANALNDAPVGTIMEVCPEGLALVQDLALRIEECKGSALMIDYGNEGSRDTLRAFRKHQQVDMLSRPGTVDITADVDFGALRNAVNYDLSSTRKKSSQGDREIELTEAFGPQKQGQFLASMGAVERTLQLIEDDSTTDDQAEELYTALKRLLSEEDMGERFKVLAIAHKKDGIFPPAGF
jgi:NADH dehydrogenase [ubiquinone] 1 alpha subcomplex assembly factor 7